VEAEAGSVNVARAREPAKALRGSLSQCAWRTRAAVLNGLLRSATLSHEMGEMKALEHVLWAPR
jgi:hypothetical protein